MSVRKILLDRNKIKKGKINIIERRVPLVPDKYVAK